MSVLTFALNDKFVIRVIKHYTTNPSRQWANTYEFVANESGELGDLSSLSANVVLFERAIHNTFTEFDRVVVSTWSPDSTPYNPDNFYVVELVGLGTRDTTGELEPITTCLSVARVPYSGRLGHIFYRGILSQGDTSAPSGITVLNDAPALQLELDTALGDSGLSDSIGPGATSACVLAMVNKTGTLTRQVNQLLVAGVTQLPVDHAWFNRTAP